MFPSNLVMMMERRRGGRWGHGASGWAHGDEEEERRGREVGTRRVKERVRGETEGAKVAATTCERQGRCGTYRAKYAME